MAAVYKAYQPAMERIVAIKVLPRHMASSDEFVERFRREAKMLAKLQHPNILPVFDYGEAEGYPYIVMPFVQGGTLSQSLHNTQVPLADVSRIMTQLGKALSYAHTHGMIHRDVKPSNVLLDDTGNCLLTDFGLARMTESTSKITSSGAVMGTPSYMSPEQGTGAELDNRSDLYSLGVILYEMLTGRVPYSAETPIAVVLKHIQDPLPSVRKFNPDVPEAVELVLLKSLAKHPEDRYQTADEFVNALQAAIAGEIGMASGTIPSAGTRAANATTLKPAAGLTPAKPQKRSNALAIGIAVVLCITVLGVGAIFTMSRFVKATPEPASPALTATVVGVLPVTESSQPPVEAPSPSPEPGPPEISPWITDAKGVTMALIPAGEFTMGNSIDQVLAECRNLFPASADANCKAEFYLDETPAHPVQVSAFYMDKYEVTNQLYKACVSAGACKPPAQSSSATHNAYYGNPEFNSYPVIWVDWNMAKAYCEWRGARLPTEAEWEKAARGDSGHNYPWGERFEGAKANACDVNCQADYADKNFNDGFAEIAPADAFENGASVFGVVNLAGNVSEWVSDWYMEPFYVQPGSGGPDPLGPQGGEKRVIRGGSWFRYPINLRTVTRSSREPSYTANDVGFRCVMPAP